MDVSLYADHQHRLLELEILKWEDAPIQAPLWETLSVTY